MKQVWLWGVFEQKTGGLAARQLVAEVSVSGKDDLSVDRQLDDAARASLEAVRAILRDDCGSMCLPCDNAGPSLEVKIRAVEGGETPEVLQDGSYSLPIYVAALADLLDLDVPDDIAGSGLVQPGGALGPIAGASAKAAAAGALADAFLMPEGTRTTADDVVPVRTARTAAFAWLGVPLLRAMTTRNLSVEDAVAVFADFMEGHLRLGRLTGIGSSVVSLCGPGSVLRAAFEQHRGAWLVASLGNLSVVPESQFTELKTLLDPREESARVWASPDSRERLIVDSFDSLQMASQLSATARLRCASTILRIARQHVDLGHLMREGSRALSSVVGLLHATANEAKRDSVCKRASDDLRTRVGELLRLGRGRTGAPTSAEEPALECRIVYDEGGLAALEWAGPGLPADPGDVIAHPAALYDRSKYLPPSWTRTDWTEDMSALDNLKHSGTISQLFGNRNEFVFPPFVADGFETRILWGDGTGTWPPSIDTLHLVSVLRDHGYFGRDVDHGRLLDLGCGTGVLGLVLARNSRVSELTFVDVEVSARLTASANTERNLSRLDPGDGDRDLAVDGVAEYQECRVRLFTGEAAVLLADEVAERGPYDLTICTPPYIPFVDRFRDPAMWRAVSGTDLLRYVLRSWREFTRELVVQFSDVAFPEVADDLSDAELIGEHYVAFKVPPLVPYFSPASPDDVRQRGEVWYELAGSRLIDTESTGNEYIREHHHGFKLFHKIRTYVLRQNTRRRMRKECVQGHASGRARNLVVGGVLDELL